MTRSRLVTLAGWLASVLRGRLARRVAGWGVVGLLALLAAWISERRRRAHESAQAAVRAAREERIVLEDAPAEARLEATRRVDEAEDRAHAAWLAWADAKAAREAVEKRRRDLTGRLTAGDLVARADNRPEV